MITPSQYDTIQQAASHGNGVSELLLSHLSNPDSDQLSDEMLLSLVGAITEQLRTIQSGLGVAK